MFRDGRSAVEGAEATSIVDARNICSHVIIVDEYIADDYKTLIRRLTFPVR